MGIQQVNATLYVFDLFFFSLANEICIIKLPIRGSKPGVKVLQPQLEKKLVAILRMCDL